MIKISLLIASFIIIFSFLLNKTLFSWEKLTQYECGFESFEEKIGVSGRNKFFIKFYFIGLIFLVFDIESILLFPIVALINNYPTIFAYSIFLYFMIFLILGLFYEYKQNVLN